MLVWVGMCIGLNAKGQSVKSTAPNIHYPTMEGGQTKTIRIKTLKSHEDSYMETLAMLKL
jgi:hypothetical protein